jgi:hypothetical protein
MQMDGERGTDQSIAKKCEGGTKKPLARFMGVCGKR